MGAGDELHRSVSAIDLVSFHDLNPLARRALGDPPAARRRLRLFSASLAFRPPRSRSRADARLLPPFEPQGAKGYGYGGYGGYGQQYGGKLFSRDDSARPGVAQPAPAQHERSASSGNLNALYANGAVGGGAGDESSGPDPLTSAFSNLGMSETGGGYPGRSATAPLIPRGGAYDPLDRSNSGTPTMQQQQQHQQQQMGGAPPPGAGGAGLGGMSGGAGLGGMSGGAGLRHERGFV